MTTEQTKQFRTELKALITINRDLARNKEHLANLNSWDKHGSHMNAILNTINQRHHMVTKRNEMLKGYPYTEWLAANRKIGGLMERLKRAKTGQTKTKIELELAKIEFTL